MSSRLGTYPLSTWLIGIFSEEGSPVILTTSTIPDVFQDYRDYESVGLK